MQKNQEVFDEFMLEYSKLTTIQKGTELIEKEKYILAFLIKYANDLGIDINLFKNKNLLSNDKDIDSNLCSMMVFMHNIEELIGIILEKNTFK